MVNVYRYAAALILAMPAAAWGHRAAGSVGAPATEHPRTVWLTNFLREVKIRGGFEWTIEDIVPVGKVPYVGLAGARVPAPQKILTLPEAVRLLRRGLKDSKVWRGGPGGRVIHIAVAKALKWKANPLNRKLTFRGTMTVRQFVSRVLRKRFPTVHFYYLPTFGPGHGSTTTWVVPGSPNFAPIPTGVRLKFNFKNTTLRHVLTTCLARRPFWAWPWQAQYWTRHGKFTGQVEVTILETRGLAPPPGKHPKGSRPGGS